MIKNSKIKSSIKYFEIFFIIITTLVSFIPFLWLILTSFKFRTDILSPVLKLFFTPTLSNYIKAFVEGEFSTYFLNSITIATGNVILCLFIGLPAAYAFSRFKVFGENKQLFWGPGTFGEIGPNNSKVEEVNLGYFLLKIKN